jgi:hypothetical protein
MRSHKTFCVFFAAPMLLSLAPGAHAVELLTNGDLESWAFTAPTSWAYTAGQPGSGQTTPNSPFTGIYPAGTSSLLFVDGPSVDSTPFLAQSFTPQAAINFSVDFRMNTQSGSNWYYVVEGNHSNPVVGLVTAFVFGIDDASGNLVDNNNSPILALTPNVWYHLEGTADIGTHLLSGSVTPFGGSPTSYSNVGFNAFTVDLRRVSIQDSSSAGPGPTFQNGDILVDNFSVVGIPEPAGVFFLAGGAALLFRRGARGRGRRV